MLQKAEDDASAALTRFRLFRASVPPTIRLKAHRVALRAEHWAVIAIAAIDALNWHNFIFIVSVWLLIAGLVAEFFESLD